MPPSAERVRAPRGASLVARVRSLAEQIVSQAEGARWPTDKWASDPAGFARDVIGIELMPHQIEIMEAVRDNEKVAVRSGNKCGKTCSIIILALWWYCSFPDARVIMSARTDAQVNRVMFRELKKLHRRAVIKIDGFLGESAHTGLKSSDLREITGHTAREVEAISGVSGARIMYIVDEASGLPQLTLEAYEGNLAAGGRLAMISNPTRTEGPFFDAFHGHSDYWRTIHVDAEKVAEQIGDREIPGIANRRKIALWREEYGAKSAFYLVRVRGEFVRNEAGKPITLDDITDAQERWADAPDEGILSIGLDPAGPGLAGDETAFGLVRGYKVLGIYSFIGLSEDAIVENLQGFLKTHRKPQEVPRVTVDNEGPIGSSLYYRLRSLADRLYELSPGESFTVHGVKASQKARREPNLYERIRDELFANLAKWMHEGGAIPPDHKLAADLHAPSWIGQVSGKLKLTPKDDIRELLGRSPDRGDALALAAWLPVAWLAEAQETGPALVRAQRGTRGPSDPYEMADGFDPYAFQDEAENRR